MRFRTGLIVSYAAFCIAAGPVSKPSAQPSNEAAASAPSQAGKPRVVGAPIDRRSADGVELPDLVAKFWWSNAKLGVIGPIIGSIPELAGPNGRVFSLSGDSGTARRAREYIGKCNVDVARYDWVASGIGGCTFALLRLTDGRVSGVCLLNNYETAAWKNVREVIARSAISQGDGFRVGQIGYHMTTSGEWTKTFRVWEPTGAKNQTQVTKTEQHPAALLVEADDYDFRMATRCSTQQAFDAVLAGKVNVGMSPIEAYFAMRKYDLRRVQATDGTAGETWVWTENVSKTTRTFTFESEFGPSVMSERSITEHVVAKASIEDGCVASFEWSTD